MTELLMNTICFLIYLYTLQVFMTLAFLLFGFFTYKAELWFALKPQCVFVIAYSRYSKLGDERDSKSN